MTSTYPEDGGLKRQEGDHHAHTQHEAHLHKYRKPCPLNIQGDVSGICSTLPLTDKGILDLLSTW